MPSKLIYIFGEGRADAGDELRHLIGGKGASLCELTRAGFNVPPGFIISTECCEYYHGNAQTWPEHLEEQVRDGITWLQRTTGKTFGDAQDSLLVAVRSGAAPSMPGMMDTILNVGKPTGSNPWDGLHSAINTVFDSWTSERAVAYRSRHRIDGMGTAVVIQAMCRAEFAGVLFTVHPADGSPRMIVESSPGLGDAVVQGRATPQRIELDRATLSIVNRTMAEEAPSLTDSQWQELASIGLRVEQHFRNPCDIEWAFADGRFHLLQARAIRIGSSPAAEKEAIRREEIEALRQIASSEGTVWARYNVAEIMPTPTPMSWALMRRLMSGKGGFGLMYRDLGFDPDPALDDAGVFDLICGRPYCNLSREPRMQYRTLPFEHPFNFLKAHPEKAIYPQAAFNPRKASWRFWLFLPVLFWKLARSSRRIKKLSRDFASVFRDNILPPFLADVNAALAEDHSRMSTDELISRFDTWSTRTLVTFARESLKPTALAALALGELQRGLSQLFSKDIAPATRVQVLLQELMAGIRPENDADLTRAFQERSAGQMSERDFLERFGHRGSQEMEIAEPRFADRPPVFDSALPVAKTAPSVEERWQAVVTESGMPARIQKSLEEQLGFVRTYTSLRETAKHHWLKGYYVLRKMLRELDRRFSLDSGVFFLTPDELPRLPTWPASDLQQTIEARRRRRQLALEIDAPVVIFSDDLEAIGQPSTSMAGETLHGIAVSAGVAEGPALVVDLDATQTPSQEDYILICPNSDPAWLPHMAKAKGVVMEVGGMLSHSAILARELGLPAVAGVPEIQRRVKTGQRLRVDGSTGEVRILDLTADRSRHD